tara:strand:- start:1181 stop:1285 length:105 start_codon:yes stop_codon:yes gene_type:complete
MRVLEDDEKYKNDSKMVVRIIKVMDHINVFINPL